MTPRTRHNIKNGFYLILFLAAVMGFTFWFMTLAAQATGPNGEWHSWEVQGDYGPDWDQNYAEAFAEPQKHVGEGQLAPECGTWYQQDFYPYKAEKNGKSIDAVIEDGLLHDGEDHHLTGHADGKWEFVYGGDCAPEPDPTPEPSPTPEPEVTHGEAVAAVGECVGDDFVTTTTVTPWTEVDGERTYGEPVTTVTSEPDATCEVAPTPEPEPEVTPEPTPEPSVTPVAEPEPTEPAASTSPDATPVLAATGADTSTPLMIAAALALVGAGVAVMRRAVK